ncbi:hypothetical protein [Vibrio algarum]|uniref:Uncharacterized protein n=1 Tax=Vibrio algarum TaxID=3020714 RepID=A0ABT4YUB5_9VIBR|nr:hypothetical protein [Vibrio sp. KJ40-1]MDB1125171.1 hypothetical protein [Vibrio sp. KJ40-1]
MSCRGCFVISVEPDYNVAIDGEMPINVVVTPKAKNIVQVGAGVVSDIGLRASLRWLLMKHFTLALKHRVCLACSKFNFVSQKHH